MSAQASETIPEEGDVVVGKDRPFITTGTRVARVEANDLPALLVQRVCRIRATSQDGARVFQLSEDQRDLLAAETRFHKLSAAIDELVPLLNKHRQAIMTAAVTGQLDIPAGR